MYEKGKPTILIPKENLKDQIATATVFEVLYEAYPAPKFKWTFLAENENKDEDITYSFLVVNKVDGAFRFRSLLLLNRTYTGRTGHYRIDIWNCLGHASRQIYIQDNIAEERRRSELSDFRHSERLCESCTRELAALRPYEDLSINVEISAYDDINESRGLTNPRDLARANSNEQGSTNSSASGMDMDEDGYLNMKEHDSPAICIRQFIYFLSVIYMIREDPNEPDSTGNYVSGADKDADGQNIPNFCKRLYTKSTGSIENKQYLEDEGYIQMEGLYIIVKKSVTSKIPEYITEEFKNVE
ncbi:hypothetical protein KUTeg_005736 [Tegillarca granosa]|uniref:Uncharacterized protein n=1 Tax=Tegillarca granosa TaxID=220873 RepID=A0ABQ9FJJ3_TEGGR|nr:hypothetical protein KUTeg_005736 [Tegillarca granosa]